MHALASINIWMNPNLFQVGGLVLSWHGLLTFVAVATAVYLVARWGTKEGLNTDAIYSVSVWAIIGGIVGARVVHVIDFWGDVYRHDPLQVFYLWNGGIALYGAISGGFVGGSLYMMVRNSRWFLALWGRFFRFAGEATKAPLPSIGHLADITAPALLVAMAIGRIGDVINGEHCASVTNLPWGVIYTHPASPGRLPTNLGGCGGTAQHPAVAYELLFDLALLAVIWPLRNRLRPPGMVFVLYGALYSVGRFFLSFLRDELKEYFLGLNEAQLAALVVMVVTIPLLVYRAQLVRAPTKSGRATGRRRAR